MMRVIGIDPSMTATGIAHTDGGLIVCGGDSILGDRRLINLHIAVSRACLIGDPQLAVIEDLPSHAQSAGITGRAQGVVRLALQQLEIPYAAVVPATLKKFATGHGNASKSDMRMALYKRAGLDESDDNKVDAWWLRAMGMAHLGSPLITLPSAQCDSLKKVKWPS